MKQITDSQMKDKVKSSQMDLNYLIDFENDEDGMDGTIEEVIEELEED